VAQYLYFLFRWLTEVFRADPEAIQRSVDQADRDRPQFDLEPSSPPEFMTLIVAVFLTILFVIAVILIYQRLIHRIGVGNEGEVEELRSSVSRGGLGDLLRRARERLSRLGDGADTEDTDARSAIRRHYRSFQTLMARAGLPRSESQTAEEFEVTVRDAVPDAAQSLATLTDAYVLARYAAEGAPLPAPEVVGQAVTQVRDALRLHDERLQSPSGD
jgi:hypothetical protein